jgi:hypothetical protein
MKLGLLEINPVTTKTVMENELILTKISCCGLKAYIILKGEYNQSI